MKTIILILIIASFLQSTIFSLDLVLIILICRSYIRPGRNNLYLAFGFGLFNSQLNLTAFGLQSIIYLFIVAITESLSRSRLAGNPLIIIPLSFFLISFDQIVLSMVVGQSIRIFPTNLIGSLLSLPILYVVRLWEERFIVRSGIKLKV